MKLFTQEINKKLFAQYSKGSDLSNQMVVAKIFNPYGRGTWYLINSDEDDPDYLWAIVDLFEVEVGSVSRKELESIKIKPFNFGLERDLSFSPKNAEEVFKGLLSGKTYAKGGKLKYDPTRDVVAIAIKDGVFNKMFTKGDFLGGAYQMESGGVLKDYNYVSPRNIIFARLKSGEDIKPVNGFYIRKNASGTVMTEAASKPLKKASVKSLKISIPRPILLTGSPSKSPKMMKFIGTFSGKDLLRPAMTFVQVKEGGIVATDAHKLIRITDGSTLKEDKLVCESTKCRNEKPDDKKFPIVSQVINSIDSEFSESYDMVELYESLMQVRNDDLKNKVSKMGRVIELKLENQTIYFNITLLLECVKGCLLLGWKKAFISYSQGRRAIVFTEEKAEGRLREVSLILLMPILGSESVDNVTITPKILLEQGGMMGEGSETMIQPTILQNNPNYLVGTESMYEMFEDGGRIKGRNNVTGESFGVVIGSAKKYNEGFGLVIRKSYGARIQSFKFTFDENGNLMEILDYGYSLDNIPPDVKKGGGSGRSIFDSNKSTSIKEMAKLTSPVFAKKLYDFVQQQIFANGGMMAKGGRLLATRERYILELKGLAKGLRPEAIDKFIDDNDLTNSEILNIIVGLGRKQISSSDFVTALVGNKNNQKFKNLMAFIKSDKAMRLADGGVMDDDEGVDLFEDYEDQPAEVQAILAKYELEDNDYNTLNKLQAELEEIGYTFEYGLDAEPFDLRKIGQKGKSEFYAKGGMTYQDLSLEKPSIVNETKIESERFKIDEVDLFRKSKKSFSGSPTIRSSADSVKIFREFWDEQSLTIFESFNVMLLNQANKIIGLYQHSKGGITGTVADPEMVVLSAVKSLAKGVIISHNHPSGNLTPSQADIEMTNKIKSALKFVDVRLLDSIIITENSYYSFADEGKMALGGMMAKGGKIREFDDVLVISKNKLGTVEAIAGETYYISTPFGESFEATLDDLRRVKSFAQGGAMEHMIFKGDKVLAIHRNMLIVESNFGLINIIDLSTEPLATRIGVPSTRGKNTLLAAIRHIDYLASRKPKTMAIGGSLQGHGFEVGDLIVEDLGGYIRVTSEDGKDFFITLRTGDRETEAPLPFKHGGKVKHSDVTRLATKTNEAGDEVVDLADFYEQGGNVPQVFDVPAQFLDSDGQRKNDRKTIRELTDFVLALPQTKEIYFNQDLGDYTPSRKKLHAEIINKFKKEVVCINNDKPIAIFMGGSPASGKSSFLRKYSPFLLKEEILKIDADEIRAMLPEYEGWNAAQTHLETKDIVNILLSNKNIGIPCDFDIIYDGTMNSVKSYIPLMDILRKRGYKIFIVFMDNVPKDVIIKRALDRYKSSGRFVPLEVIEDFFTKGKSAFNELKKDVDGYIVVDGSNQDYKIIEEGGIKLPRDRKYSKLGTKINPSDIPVSYKKGGMSKLY